MWRAACVLLGLAVACGPRAAEPEPPGSGLVGLPGPGPGSPAESREERVITVVARVPDLVTFPCAERCHGDREPDPTPRTLTEFHTTIELAHGSAAQWCGFCHRVEDPDHLRLINGATVSFDDSDQVCGQCHGEMHRDWAEGIHGLDTGTWNGAASRRTCTACHDPHAPGPLTLVALPPPSRVGAPVLEDAP